jgi:chromosome segregation ATPase
MRFKNIKEFLMSLTSKEKEQFKNQIKEAQEREASLIETKEKTQKALMMYKENLSIMSKDMAGLFEKLQNLNTSLGLLNEKLAVVKEVMDKNNDKILELQLLTMNKGKIGKA